MLIDALTAFVPLIVALIVALTVDIAVVRHLGPRLTPRDRALLTLWFVFMLAVGVTLTARQSLGNVLKFAVAFTLLAVPAVALSALGRRALSHSSPESPDKTGDKSHLS